MQQTKILDRTISILGQLISFPEIGGKSNAKIAGFIDNYCALNGVHLHKINNHSDRKTSLFGRIGPEESDGIILSGHTDVVPANPETWQSNPFELQRSNGKLIGRGTCDMKGFLACCLAFIPEFLSKPLRKPVYLAFSYDEEVGCLAGRELAEQIRLSFPEKPGFAIIGEPTMMSPVIAGKGIAVFRTVINAQNAHSSLISFMPSAVHEMAKLIRWLDEKMQSLAGSRKLDMRFDPPHTTIHCGVVQGGVAVNVIADHCEFQWDLRTIPQDSIQEILGQFETYCRNIENQTGRSRQEFRIITEPVMPPVPSLDTPADSYIVRLIQRLTGKEKAMSVAFASEAGQFAEAGFESVICGPGSIEQAHKPDEYIEIGQLVKCLKFLEDLSDELCK